MLFHFAFLLLPLREVRIMSRKILMIFLSLALLQSAVAQDIPKPTRTAVPTLEKHRAILSQSIALHDRGDYDNAILGYEEILKQNPDDTVAIYEMAYSYSAKKDYRKSLELAYRGAQYSSKQLAAFYVMIGSNLDLLGQADNAVNVYKAGIKLFPENSLMHFNLGVTLIGQNNPLEARKSFREAVVFNPVHPGSHLALGDLYFKGNYPLPALMAMSRFLVLEPKTRRSSAALQVIRDVLGRAATRDPNTGTVRVTLDASVKKDEGDFETLMTALGLVGASRYLEENEKKTEMQIIVDQITTLFAIMSEGDDKKQSGFAWNYYRPYFIEMSRRKLVEPFCYYIYQSSQSAEVARWLDQNAEKVNEFVAWSQSYRWPRVK
jgi:tetratricopeptide (TPR) repeat protein